jgi:hypothetical protein
MTTDLNITLIIGAIATGLTWYYSHQSNKRANDILEKELFVAFNKKYDELNSSLQIFIKTKESNFSFEGEIQNDIIDYFNLCAEEYYWYKKGRISKEVWLSWRQGMTLVFANNQIKELWEQETKNKGYVSYYLKSDEKYWEVD